MNTPQQIVIDMFSQLSEWEDVLAAVTRHAHTTTQFAELTPETRLTRCKSNTHVRVRFVLGVPIVDTYSDSKLIDGYLNLMKIGMYLPDIETDWYKHMELAGINKHMLPEQLDGVREAIELINRTLIQHGTLKAA